MDAPHYGKGAKLETKVKVKKMEVKHRPV